jgi:hypothetical protein
MFRSDATNSPATTKEPHMETTNSAMPSASHTAKAKRKRAICLREMRAQAERDATEAVTWLRDRIERYHALDPACEEAEDIVFAFTDCLIVWANEARFEATPGIPCGLSLDLDCEDAEGYTIDEFEVVSASVIYRGGIYVHVPKVQTELQELLTAVQAIVDAEEERQ